MKTEACERIKNLRIRRGESQTQFGELLGVGQTTVSGLEVGDISPSLGVCFHLSTLAFDPDDSIFFLRQADIPPDMVVSLAAVLGKGGINMDPILPVAEAALGEKLELKSQREVEGKDFIVLPFKGTQPVGFEVTVPASRVSNLSSTVYVVVGTKSLYARAGHGVRAGEIIVLDSHKISSYDEILGEKAVFEFEDGLFVGQLGYISEGATRHLVIGPADEIASNWSFQKTPDLWVISSHHTNSNLPERREMHEVRRYLGIWIAQFTTDAPAEWKTRAAQHKPRK
jgi:DNA-binding XRE family transcriptional regulator